MATDPGPLKPDVFWILTALAGSACHGYALLQEVERLSAGHLRLRPGPLYRRLARLLDDGLIDEAEDPAADDPGHDPRRRIYRITDAGRTAVQAETERLAHALYAARAAGFGRKG